MSGTAGNHVRGTTIQIGKPVLPRPEAVLEQCLNSTMVERMGAGMHRTHRHVAPSGLDYFLGNGDDHRANVSNRLRYGLAEAVDAPRRFVDELACDARKTCLGRRETRYPTSGALRCGGRLVTWREAERRRVDAVAQTGGPRPVVEDMP